MTEDEYRDVCESFTLALTAEGVDPQLIERVQSTVFDAVDNNTAEDVPQLLVTGSPAIGFTIYGPFDTPDAASDAAESLRNDFAESWWIMDLFAPSEV